MYSAIFNGSGRDDSRDDDSPLLIKPTAVLVETG